MKIYFKEYGWVRASFIEWIKYNLICKWRGHQWHDLGDPCWCGSDNCEVCLGCGWESHD